MAATKVSTCAPAPVKTSTAESWKKQHEWLDWKIQSSDKRSVDVLFCSVCKAFAKDKINNYVQGCRNMKKYPVRKHERSNEHPEIHIVVSVLNMEKDLLEWMGKLI